MVAAVASRSEGIEEFAQSALGGSRPDQCHESSASGSSADGGTGWEPFPLILTHGEASAYWSVRADPRGLTVAGCGFWQFWQFVAGPGRCVAPGEPSG